MARKSKEFRQLFYPDSVQKQNRSPYKSQRQKEIESLKLFKQEMENNPDNENAEFVENPKGFRKMSEVLLEYIQPFLEDTETYQERSKLVDVAVMAWNLSLISEEKRQEFVTQVVTELFSEPEEIEVQKEFKRLVNKSIKRKLKFFAEEERFVKDFKLTENAGDLHLSVASSLTL